MTKLIKHENNKPLNDKLCDNACIIMSISLS